MLFHLTNISWSIKPSQFKSIQRVCNKKPPPWPKSIYRKKKILTETTKKVLFITQEPRIYVTIENQEKNV